MDNRPCNKCMYRQIDWPARLLLRGFSSDRCKKAYGADTSDYFGMTVSFDSNYMRLPPADFLCITQRRNSPPYSIFDKAGKVCGEEGRWFVPKNKKKRVFFILRQP